MLTEKMNNELIVILYDSRLEIDNYQEGIDKILKLFNPKLQWKSEKITNDGGDNLLGIKYTIENIDILVTIYASVEHSNCSVIWNGKRAYTGALEECKQFCTDKVLNDFLKLCE